MKIEFDRLKFWMIVFIILSIPAIAITYLISSLFYWKSIPLLYLFLFLLAISLSIPQSYTKIEEYNKTLNDFIIFTESEITVKCLSCNKIIHNRVEMLDHRINCKGKLLPQK